MQAPVTSNVNIVSHSLLCSPAEVLEQQPLPAESAQRILGWRESLRRILDREDRRLFIVVGPCSIHDPAAAREYACRLRGLAERTKDVLFLVMRVYFEKPRTVSGWKGYLNDPHLDDSFRIEEGIHLARELLLELAALGVPTGTEALDPITPQFLGDLITWTAIGARTTESQTHREMASGLSTPVGFKNGTDGSVDVAINAIRSAALPHRFLGINPRGRCAVFHTRGNRYGHVVLRGGASGPNYDPASISACTARLRAAGLPENVVVDCSHANSGKDPARQPAVFREVLGQIAAGEPAIVGLMLESHLQAGRQDIPADPSQLTYGVSITDACIGWETTEDLLLEAAETLRARKD